MSRSKSQRQPVEYPWQRLYRSAGDALDAMLDWRRKLPKSQRPEIWTIGPAIGDSAKRYMITCVAPGTVTLEIFEDGLQEAERTPGVRVSGYLHNCADEATALQEG